MREHGYYEFWWKLALILKKQQQIIEQSNNTKVFNILFTMIHKEVGDQGTQNMHKLPRLKIINTYLLIVGRPTVNDKWNMNDICQFCHLIWLTFFESSTRVWVK